MSRWQQIEPGAHEEFLEAREEGFHRGRVVSEPATLGGKLFLAVHEVAPGFVVTPQPIVEAAALEQRVAVERRLVFEDRERFPGAALPREIAGAQQFHCVGRGSRLGTVEQFLRALQIAAQFVELRPVPEREQIPWRARVGARKARVGFFELALVHEARSRHNPSGTGLGKLLALLRVLSISTYRLRLAPSQKLAEARSRP